MVTFKLEDAGRPEYLDGIQAQFCVSDEDDKPLAYFFDEAHARLFLAALQGCTPGHQLELLG